MSVLIKARQSNIADKETGKKLFYPTTKNRGQVSTDDLAQLIAKQSSLTPGDIRNVIENLGDAAQHYFQLGYSVKLEKLGTMHVTVNASGNGVETAEEVNVNQINNAHIVFREEKRRSGKTTRSALSDAITYEMYRGEESESTDDTGSTGDSGTGDTGDTGDTGGDTGGGDLLG